MKLKVKIREDIVSRKSGEIGFIDGYDANHTDKAFVVFKDKIENLFISDLVPIGFLVEYEASSFFGKSDDINQISS